jgi:hypothetical protein
VPTASASARWPLRFVYSSARALQGKGIRYADEKIVIKETKKK